MSEKGLLVDDGPVLPSWSPELRRHIQARRARGKTTEPPKIEWSLALTGNVRRQWGRFGRKRRAELCRAIDGSTEVVLALDDTSLKMLQMLAGVGLAGIIQIMGAKAPRGEPEVV